ncbi:MAG: phosphate starvation-inducible protein PhoH [Treponema sp. CETP13]|nr:MAG: phosphate starvation-inducible protein PhoH [Treponema sp. CETP13]
MELPYTIVVPDQDLLSRLCGTNDSNLRLIEEYLGTSVFSRGNELSVSEDNPEIQRQFKHLIDRITDEVLDGNVVDSHLVSSIINTTILDGEDEHAFFSKSSIVIPGSFKRVYPKSIQQARLVQALRSYDMVFCVGPAGSGKTFLMMAEALNLLLSHKKSKIVISRPVVEAGESLGYLPGNMEEKVSPYLRPLYDTAESLLPKETVQRFFDLGAIEIAPLAYMRGRTLNDCVIILDEAQNTTCRQMKMFLTRMGENSKVFVTGDITQTDLPKRTMSGLVEAINILKNIDEIKTITMDSESVVRNLLVKKIVQAYEDYGDN